MAESSRSHHRFAEEWFEKLSAATVSPHSFTPFVKSGLGITRGKYVVGSQGRGTAGLIVRKAGTTTGAQLLTCAHVLGTPRDGSDQAAIEDNQVYSPHFKDCCGIECNSPIGMVIAGTLESRGPEFDQTTGERFVQAQLKIGQEAFAVDAALVDLVANINSYNRAPEIGQILPPRDLIVEWSLSDAKQLNLALPASRRLHVKKYGATTGYTEGTIRRLARKTVREYVPGAAAPVDTPALVFEIDPDPGQKAFSGEWEPDMDKYRSVLGPAITAKDVANRFASPSVTVIVGGTDSRPILRFSWSTFSQPDFSRYKSSHVGSLAPTGMVPCTRRPAALESSTVLSR